MRRTRRKSKNLIGIQVSDSSFKGIREASMLQKGDSKVKYNGHIGFKYCWTNGKCKRGGVKNKRWKGNNLKGIQMSDSSSKGIGETCYRREIGKYNRTNARRKGRNLKNIG